MYPQDLNLHLEIKGKEVVYDCDYNSNSVCKEFSNLW